MTISVQAEANCGVFVWGSLCALRIFHLKYWAGESESEAVTLSMLMY